MQPLRSCILAAATLALTTAPALAQRGGAAAGLYAPMSRTTLPERPAGREAQEWMSKEVRTSDGWRVVRRDEAGAVLTKAAGAVSSTGSLEIDVRLEYRQPQMIDGDAIRSVRATLAADCVTLSLRGPVDGFEGQNLTGPRHSEGPADLDRISPERRVQAERAKSDALKLLTSSTLRETCVEANRRVAERYGPEWRALAVDGKATRLAGRPDGYDPLQITFRIEAVLPQKEDQFKWRAAVAKTRVICPTGAIATDVTYFAGANQTGETKVISYEGRRGRLGAEMKTAGGAWTPVKLGADGAPDGPGAALMLFLRSGSAILDECESAKARMIAALATPDAPERKKAESWVSEKINTKGWRMPAYIPEGVILLSDEVAATQSGARRALVRTEYQQPIPMPGDKVMASRITVVEFDCSQQKFRSVAENVFAKNGAKEPVVQAPTPQTPWRAFDDEATMGGFGGAVCATKTTS